MNVTEIKDIVERYNSVLHSVLGGIKQALETHPDDPNQATIQKEIKDAIAATQSQIADLDGRIVSMSHDVVELAAQMLPLVKLGEELATEIAKEPAEEPTEEPTEEPAEEPIG